MPMLVFQPADLFGNGAALISSLRVWTDQRPKYIGDYVRYKVFPYSNQELYL
jgi:hypothetical protein